MTLKDKMKTYNFWISIASAIVLILRIIGEKFNFFVDATLIMDITTGLCSIFVICGILSVPKSKNSTTIQSVTEESLNNVTEMIENITDAQVSVPSPSKEVLDKIQEIETQIKDSTTQEVDKVPDANEIEEIENIGADKNSPEIPSEENLAYSENGQELIIEPCEAETSFMPQEEISFLAQTADNSAQVKEATQQLTKAELTDVVENLKKAIYDASKILETINQL